MKPPFIGPREVVYENRYQKIYRVCAEFENFKKEFFVNSLNQRVGLVMVRKCDEHLTESVEILLVRQYRLLINDLSWEIPGGRIDTNETPEQGVIREGLEETCLRCRSVKPLLYFHPGLDTFDNPTFLFFCDDFEEETGTSFHPHEVSERTWVPLTKCLKMIFQREIVDCMTITALLAYHALRDRPESERFVH